MSEERSSLSADSPLKHPNEDELGYARFAEQLAHAVVRMAPNDRTCYVSQWFLGVW